MSVKEATQQTRRARRRCLESRSVLIAASTSDRVGGPPFRAPPARSPATACGPRRRHSPRSSRSGQSASRTAPRTLRIPAPLSSSAPAETRSPDAGCRRLVADQTCATAACDLLASQTGQETKPSRSASAAAGKPIVAADARRPAASSPVEQPSSALRDVWRRGFAPTNCISARTVGVGCAEEDRSRRAGDSRSTRGGWQRRTDVHDVEL